MITSDASIQAIPIDRRHPRIDARAGAGMIDTGSSLLSLPVSLPVLAACVLVMFAAYVVFGVSGFGASLISIPLLSQLVPLPLLLSLAVASDLSASISLAVAGRVRARAGRRATGPGEAAAARDSPRVDRAELWRLAPASLLGAAIGVTLLVGLPRSATMSALGVFLLCYGLWSLRARIPETPLSARWGYPSGFAGGLLGAMFGIGGPPYVIYLSRRILDKDRLRATLGVVVLASLSIRFLAFLGAGLLMQQGLLAMLAVLLPVCIGASLAGGRLVRHLSREHLLRIISLLLVVSGATLLLRVIIERMS